MCNGERLSLLVFLTSLLAILGGCEAEIFESQQRSADVFRAAANEHPVTGHRDHLSVMSWNIKGSLTSRDPAHVDLLAAAIREIGADVVLLQEVHRGTRGSRGRDQFRELGERLGMSGCFGASLAVGDGSYGNAILLSGEVESSTLHLLPGRGEPRTVLECVASWDGVEVPILTTHLTAWDRANRRTRIRQVTAVEEIVEHSESALVILGGDFNASLQAPEMGPLVRHATLSPVFSGYVVTHPGTGRSYDHLFIGDGWHVRSSRVRRAGPSDHWAIIAEIAWKEASGNE